MSQPEIARRCPRCGASIREASLFCPQCGNGLPQRDLGETQPLAGPLASQAEETIPKSAVTESDSGVEPGLEARQGAPVDFRNESQKKARQRRRKEAAVKAAAVKAPATEATEATRASMGQAARGAVGAKIQRATTLARDVEGDVKHRARKVREISSVVLDEAGDDPSLRFVLVAAVLFLLFLIIVVLNRFIS